MHFYNHFEPSNFYKYSQFFTLYIPRILLDPERYLVPSLSRHNPAVYSAYQENIIYTITASQHVSAHTARLLILNASRTYCVCLSFGVRQSQTAGLMWRLAEGVVGPIGRVNFPLYMIHGFQASSYESQLGRVSGAQLGLPSQLMPGKNSPILWG